MWRWLSRLSIRRLCVSRKTLAMNLWAWRYSVIDTRTSYFSAAHNKTPQKSEQYPPFGVQCSALSFEAPVKRVFQTAFQTSFQTTYKRLATRHYRPFLQAVLTHQLQRVLTNFL